MKSVWDITEERNDKDNGTIKKMHYYIAMNRMLFADHVYSEAMDCASGDVIEDLFINHELSQDEHYALLSAAGCTWVR